MTKGIEFLKWSIIFLIFLTIVDLSFVSATYTEIFNPVQYPYVDVNTSFFMSYKVIVNNVSTNIGIVNLSINNSVFPLTWNSGNSEYEETLNFTGVGDYPFIIFPHNSSYSNLTGTFLVRNPYNVTFCGFEKSSWLNSVIFGDTTSSYENDYAYLTAEFTNGKTYSPILESYSDPLDINLQMKNVFYTPYIDGCGTLKLYDNSSYAIRLIDGQITFNNNYGKMNITKSYGTKIFIGTFNLNPSTSGYNLLFSETDKRPYFALFNWIAIGVIILCLFASLIMFFMLPRYPVLSIGFFIISIVGTLILRIIIFFYLR